MKISKTYFLLTFLFNLSIFSQESTFSLLVSLKEEASIESVDRLKSLNNSFEVISMRALGASDRTTEKTTLLSSRVIRLKFSKKLNKLTVKKAYEDIGVFKYIELDHAIKGNIVPNDPIFRRDQYYHFNNGYDGLEGIFGKIDADMDTDLAWDVTTGNENVILGVFDTGLRLDHREFEGRLWVNTDEIPDNGIDDDKNGYIDDINGWDFVNKDNNPEDDNSHGSNVTGIAAATGNNGFGMAGMDWKCKIMVLKVLNDKNDGLFSDEIEAIFYAADNGIHIGNMSLGGTQESAAFKEAVEYAHSKGVLLIASTGNDDHETPQFPAAYPTVMAVGATHADDTRVTKQNPAGNSWGSNYGDYVDVVAPGSMIFSVRHNEPESFDFYKGGTSQSTPMVSGLACLIKGLDISKTPDEIREIIQNSAEDQVGNLSEDTPGYDKFYGFGRINAYEALLLAQSNSNELKAQFSSSKNVVCGDETILFTNRSTGDPTSLRWTFGDGASPATAVGVGPHEVTYTTNGQKTVRLEVEKEDLRDAEVKSGIISVGVGLLKDISGPEIVGVGQTKTYTVPLIDGVEEYVWGVTDGARILSGDFTNTVEVLFETDATDVELSVLIFNQCGIEEFKEKLVEVSTTLSTQNTKINQEDFRVFPNPSASGLFHLSKTKNYLVHDVSGRLLLKGTGNVIDLGKYSVGMYFLKIGNKTIKLLR